MVRTHDKSEVKHMSQIIGEAKNGFIHHDMINATSTFCAGFYNYMIKFLADRKGLI